MSSYSRRQLENWLKTIDVIGNVVDIGGSQLPIKGRTKSWNVNDYKILDLKQPHECKQQPDIKMDLNEPWFTDDPNDPAKDDTNYLTLKINVQEKADIVFCLEVSEYLWNPIQAFKNINLLLKRGGILYLSTHFIYPVHNPVKDDCLRYTENGIVKILEKTGFKIDLIIPRGITTNGITYLNGFIQSEEMRPSKEYYFHNEVGHLIKVIKI